MSLIPERSIDRRLLKAAARYATPNEMSEAVLGQLTPAQCKERVDTILESKFELDEIKERRLLLIQMAEHVQWLQDQRGNEKSWGAINRALKLVSDQIERTNINVSDINTRLSKAHAEFFVNAISKGIERAVERLSAESVEVIEAEVVSEALEIGVKSAQESLQKVTVRDSAE